MRKAAVSLGLCLGLAELVAAILIMQSVAQVGHPMNGVWNVLAFALAFLSLPVLTIAGSLLGLRYGLAGGLILLAGTVALLTVLGLGRVTGTLASMGAVAGLLLVFAALRTRSML